MRHVSRTHRVALDWLFDRINVDQKIQVKYIDTKNQFADMLTKGNFTRDEWNNLLHLFNISHSSFLCCAQSFSFTSCTKTTSKRMQEQKEEDRIVAKSKPTMNLVSLVSTSSSTVRSPLASQSLGILKAPVEQIGQVRWNLMQEIPITTQRRVLKDGKKDALLDVSTGKPFATEEVQEHLNYPEDSVSTRKLVAPGNPGNSGNSGTEGNDKDWPHNLHISTNYLQHMEKVFSIVRQHMISARRIKWRTSMWTQLRGVYSCLSLFKLQFILRKVTQKICDLSRIKPKKSLRQLFQVTERFITDQTEVTGLTTNDWQQSMWRETTLLTDRAVQFAIAKTHVFSDSVLCLGGISDEPVKAWKNKIKWYLETSNLKELDRIDGELMEFEWKDFPGFTTLGILDEIPKFMPKQWWPRAVRITFMSMTTTVYGENRAVILTFAEDVGHFLDLERRKGTIILINQMEIGTRLLTNDAHLHKAVILNFVCEPKSKQFKAEL